MKRSVSIVYTVFVAITLLSIAGLFIWRTYQSRAMRISGFEMRSNEYTRRLDEVMHESRDVDEELKIAEDIMALDPSIVAIQVSSEENKVRVSTFKPPIKNFSHAPINNSEYFDGFLARILYYKVTKPLTLNDGFEATFVSTTVTRSEIRNRLMIMLIAVIGMFFVTFVLILVNPRAENKTEPETAYEEDLSSKSEIESEIEVPESPDYMVPESDAPGAYNEIDGDVEDFAAADRFDESDLRVNMPEYGESVTMEDSVSPSLDAGEVKSDEQAAVMSRLHKELQDAVASNQDLSLLIIRGDSNIDELIREHYPYPKPVFPIDHQRAAVIESNKDLDSSMSTAKEFLRECLSRNSNLEILCGIAARNGRSIGANMLYQEAANSLLKADKESRIVGFRSDPEKYREFIRSQGISQLPK